MYDALAYCYAEGFGSGCCCYSQQVETIGTAGNIDGGNSGFFLENLACHVQQFNAFDGVGRRYIHNICRGNGPCLDAAFAYSDFVDCIGCCATGDVVQAEAALHGNGIGSLHEFNGSQFVGIVLFEHIQSGFLVLPAAEVHGAEGNIFYVGTGTEAYKQFVVGEVAVDVYTQLIAGIVDVRFSEIVPNDGAAVIFDELGR